MWLNVTLEPIISSLNINEVIYGTAKIKLKWTFYSITTRLTFLHSNIHWHKKFRQTLNPPTSASSNWWHWKVLSWYFFTKPFCIKSLITILNIAQNVMKNAKTVLQRMIYSKLIHKREIIKCSSRSKMSLEFSFHGHSAEEIKYLGKCNLLINMLNLIRCSIIGSEIDNNYLEIMA